MITCEVKGMMRMSLGIQKMDKARMSVMVVSKQVETPGSKDRRENELPTRPGNEDVLPAPIYCAPS